jgi:hypothetical protein
MEFGDVLRARTVRTYADDGRGYAEYSPISEEDLGKREKREDKEVFLFLYLGNEKLVQKGSDAERSKTFAESIKLALKELGYVGVDELETAGVDVTQFGYEEPNDGQPKATDTASEPADTDDASGRAAKAS